jgi:hypothetical protein
MGCCPARAGQRHQPDVVVVVRGDEARQAHAFPADGVLLRSGERREQPHDDGGRAVGSPDPPHPADEAVHRDRRRQEAHRGHDVRSGPRPVREVDELATGFVAEAPELRTEGVDHLAEPGQAAPGGDVADRGGTEPGQVAQDELAGGVGAVERAAQPALGEDERGLAPPAPGAVRRRVEDRQQELRERASASGSCPGHRSASARPSAGRVTSP